MLPFWGFYSQSVTTVEGLIYGVYSSKFSYFFLYASLQIAHRLYKELLENGRVLLSIRFYSCLTTSVKNQSFSHGISCMCILYGSLIIYRFLLLKFMHFEEANNCDSFYIVVSLLSRFICFWREIWLGQRWIQS